ncbi:MAG TPA: alcohol dehydrogenase catalytic domain-containing protein [Feifaniaceae bacterium]|nr:alcohol dehydrogenase catalytic domain-containing protein [Feifaniaceae bacterium]
MKAAVFEREGVLTLKEVERPKILKADDIIGEVSVCSICGTDVHMTNVPAGYPATPGTILGHELVAKVVEAGPNVKGFAVGDRFVVNPNEYCGTCRYCKKNLPNECENVLAMGIDVDGGFAEYVRVSEKMAFKIPESMPDSIAAFAEPLACAINATRKIRVNPSESVVVIGAGPIGMLFIQLMKASGAYPIISVEPNPIRRGYALKCGADYALDPINQDTKAEVLKLTEIGADYAIDVVGSQMMTAIDVIRKGGSCLLFGNNAKAAPTVTQSQITYKEARVLGTWLANASFDQAVKLLDSGVLNLEFLVTHTLPLTEIHEAIDLLRRGEGVEVLVDPRIKG